MKKSFRGLIATSGIDTILLHTNNGSAGYRMVKLELMPTNPGTTAYENVLKVYSVPQTTADGTIDFSDTTLLGAAYIANNSNNATNDETVVVFDNRVFNQDIYVTHIDMDGTPTQGVNYHIELEEIKLDLNENTVATLKDIRNVAQPT
tara:strand:+ start:487 stop:930 length:444 start_codon:yes stop_codon:yes gene_type:complete